MKMAKGNIWDWLPTHYIVVPTNIGWKTNGKNVMGAGVAKQAALKFPDFPAWLGRNYELGERGISYYQGHLIAFPVKPLAANPSMSWQNMASLELIEKSTLELCNHASLKDVVLPLVGCGNGKLKREDVLPILEKYLDYRFTLVELR
jgi:hypothetical protein